MPRTSGRARPPANGAARSAWTRRWSTRSTRCGASSGCPAAARRSGADPSFLRGVLHDLVEPLVLDIRVDLNPDREVVRELEAEFQRGVSLVREKFLDARLRDEEIERAAMVAEPLLHGRQMQDLIVPICSI